MHKCEQCDSVTINGVYTHERGCPVTNGIVRECVECGGDLEQDGRNTWFCPSCDCCPDCGEFDGHASHCPELSTGRVYTHADSGLFGDY